MAVLRAEVAVKDSGVDPEVGRRIQTEKATVRIRWAGVAFGLLQIFSFYRPHPNGVMGLSLSPIGLLATGNIVISALTRRTKSLRGAKALAVGAIGLDTAVVLGLVFAYTFDPETAIWALIYLLPLEAAIRFQVKGGLVVMLIAAIAYTLREAYGAARFGNAFLATSITFRMGIGLLLTAVCGVMASGLDKERTRAEDAVAKERKVARALQNVASAADRAVSLEEAAEVSLGEVCTLTGWPVGHLLVPAPDNPDELVSSGIWRLETPDSFADLRRVTAETAFPKGVGLPGEVAATRKPIWITDVRSHPNFPRARSIGDLGITSAFAFPVLSEDEVVSVLEFFAVQAQERDDDFLQLMAHVGHQLARVVERIRAEAELQSNVKRANDIIEAAGHAFVSMDAGARITGWNAQAEKTFGWQKDEVVGRLLADTVVPAQHREAHRRGLEQFLVTGEGPVLNRRIEITALRKDGCEIPVELTIWALRAEDSWGFNAFINDITDRRRAETALKESEEVIRAARDRAVEASRLKSQFLANMSHEIRTPMNGVLGMANLLLNTPLDVTQREYLTALHDSGQSLLGIINDILDFSKVEAGKLDLENIDFQLTGVVKGVVELSASAARRKGLACTLEVDPAVPAWVRGDPARLRQILTNLTSNAVKFTDRGSIHSRVIPGLAGRIRFEVADTGIGIDPRDRKRLLDPFSQADASTTRRFGGSGLGLTICRQLVDLMGGEMDFYGEPGKGSTFWFELPLAPAQAPETMATDPPVRSNGSRERSSGRVLLVEDSKVNQLVAGLMLEELGYQVDIRVNGAEAVEAVKENEYVAVLMDCLMPVMDGYEATAQIRRLDEPSRHTPIVAVTATAMAGDREKCLLAGMDDYVSKPLEQQALAAALARCIASDRQPRNATPPR
jgi:PAS domain S-box-containing protein